MTLINLRVRSSLAQTPMTLERLAFWTSICANRPDLSLPLGSLTTAIAFIVSCASFAALWAGALAPIIVTDAAGTMKMHIPRYEHLSGWNSGINYNDTFTTDLGVFSFQPSFQLPGIIVVNARDATSRSGGVKSHDKLDKTGYLYLTRSFGAGSTVGLVDGLSSKVGNASTLGTRAYAYQEKTLAAQVACTRNVSADVWVRKMTTPGGWALKVCTMDATLPDGQTRFSAAAALDDERAFVLAVGDLGKETNKAYLTLATHVGESNSFYNRLHHVQCTLEYTELTVEISVDVSNRTIAVTPGDEKPPEESRFLATYATTKLWDISSVLMTTSWTSLLGDMFLNNIANTEAFVHDQEDATLRGVEDSIQSMVDSILESLGAAQVMVLGDMQPTEAHAFYVGVRIGRSSFLYAVLAVHVAVAIIAMVELVLTRMWRRTPAFDYMKIGHVAIAASAGGTSIADVSSQVGGGGQVQVRLATDRRWPVSNPAFVMVGGREGHGREQGRPSMSALRATAYLRRTRSFSNLDFICFATCRLLAHGSTPSIRIRLSAR